VSAAAPALGFEYCLVRLQRRWLSEAAFDLVPRAFIAVRNLTIRAQWSSGNTQAMLSSTGLGPFSLAGQTFDAASGTLACAGMLIIGWVCERQPLIPPQGDPALAASAAAASPGSASTSGAAGGPVPASNTPAPQAAAST
jgi:hypothetical protein